jgi:hypothetical protein
LTAFTLSSADAPCWLCALPRCNRQRLTVILLGGGSIAYGIQQLASHPMQVSLLVPLVGRLYYLRSFGEAIQSFDGLTENSVGFGEPGECKRRADNSSGSTDCRQPLLEQREPFLCLPERVQPQSAVY